MSLAFSTMAAWRFGTGFRPGQLPPASVEEMLAQLDPSKHENLLFPDGGLAAARQRILTATETRAALGRAGKNLGDVTKRLFRDRFNADLINLLTKDEHARFKQAVLSPNGFNERLAMFWLNHFSVSSGKEDSMRLLVPVFEAEAIRPNMAGRFADLLKAAVLHPAMLIYLDQVKSFGPASTQGLKRKSGLNENLGRELLELHTLGAGSGYTQTDVRNAAFVLTGMTVDRKTYLSRYLADMAEPGVKTVFGASYGGKRRTKNDVFRLIEDLAAAPETCSHVCRKIAHHFLSDTPPPEVLDVMTKAWKRHDGNLMNVYTAMLRHPRSWTDEGQKAKQPFDYIVSGLRALSAEEDDMDDLGFPPAKPDNVALIPDLVAMTPTATAIPAIPPVDTKQDAPPRLRSNPLTVPAALRLGQPLWRPPSPAGFDDGFAAWIAGGPLVDRITWAKLAVTKLGGDRDPRAFLQEALRDAARQDTIDIVSKAPNRKIGLALVLASPEFNRR